MLESLNTPYVKEFKDGQLINPINGNLKTVGPNRYGRRKGFENKSRPFNNRGNISIAVYRDADNPTKVRAYKGVNVGNRKHYHLK